MSAGGVLYLAPEWPYPSRSGGRQRIAALVTAVESTGVPLTITAPDTETAWPQWAAAVRAMRDRRQSPRRRASDVAASLGAGEHVVLTRARRAGLVDAFARVVDDVHPRVTILGRPFYGPFVDVARAAGGRVVADVDESLVGVARSALHNGGSGSRARAALELGAFRRFEQREYPRIDEIWVSSSIEREAILRRVPTASVRVIPNVTPRPLADLRNSASAGVDGVAFVGWYGYPPNEHAALSLIDDVLPMVKTLGGPAKLLLIGREPTRRMLRLAQGRTDVEITGEVDDVAPYLRRAGVLVCAIRSGGGTRIKILEAMALGVPVISTSRGVEGLELVPEREVIVADSALGLATAVVRLARDATVVSRLVADAQRVVAERYSPGALRTLIANALDMQQVSKTHAARRPGSR